MMIKKVRKIARIFLISCALFLPSFSFSSYADDVNDELAYDGLQVRSYGNNNYLNPDAGLSNSIANSRDTTTYNFSGNGTFGGQNNQYNNLNVTADGGLTIESGATLSNVTLNQTLGNTQEMATLNSNVATISGDVQGILDHLVGILYCLTTSGSSSSDSIVVTTGYGSITVPLISTTVRLINFANGTFTATNSSTYTTFPAMFRNYFECLIHNLETFMNAFQYYANWIDGTLTIFMSNVNSGFTSIIDTQTYNYWYLSPSQDGETFSKTITSQSGSFHSILLNRCEYIADVLAFSFGRFYEWFYPLDNVDPKYWRYYNTDTKASENIGLAGLMYNISWYLGNLYVLQSASAALDNMEEAVENVTSTFESVEAQEQAVVDSISSHINSFNPNVSDFGIFRAIPWMSNYLQQIYISLGTYGTVITVGLFLGVCMQIIGFLRYK